MGRDRKVRLPSPPPASSSYEVGYGKPPKASQFKPGISANPKGRPRGARNKRPGPHEERLQTIVLEEAYREVKLNDGERKITVPLARAIIRSLAVNAARGQLRSQQVFMKLVFETERARKATADQLLQAAIDYKAKWERELERREKLGVSGKEPIPHPDDIHLDFKAGKVFFNGPMTKEEKVKWDGLYDHIDETDKEIEYMSAELKKTRSKWYRSSLETDIAEQRRHRKFLVDIVGEPRQRRRK
jgi:Family of unknown function (DUF5681)